MAEIIGTPEPKDNLEFERKFLLIKKPSLKADVVYRIEQHYCGDERIRRKSSEGQEDVFYHTVKKNLRPGVNSEVEKKINRDEYYNLLEKSKSFVIKDRHCYFVGGLKWEVDDFHDMNLVIAEVEYPEENYVLNIPKFIKDVILFEATNYREFSNKNISKKLTRKS